MAGTPRADGYRMPAEWDRHSGCYLVWPERPDNWRDGGKPAQRAWVELARAINSAEPVTVLANAGQWRNARSRLPAEIRVVELSTDDAWIRDTGPSFVVGPDGSRRAVSWRFNGWGGLAGGLYFPWDLDDQVAVKVAELEGVDWYQAPFVLEGGSIDVDGAGTVLTTAECLLNPNRNPEFSQAELTESLREYLGAEQVIWLPRGVYRDETSGHVDNMARFVAPGKVLLTWTDDEEDPQFERSSEALEVLMASRDAAGRQLKVIKIHQPGPLHYSAAEVAGVDLVDSTTLRVAGNRLAGSYVNSYLGNGVVVLPAFGVPEDAAAQEVYRGLFPNHKIIAVPGREILLGGGNIHCVTQQVPAGVTGGN
jgi:agmatine deiminase